MTALLKSGAAVALIAVTLPAAALTAAVDPITITNRVLAEVRKTASDGTVRTELEPAGRVTPGTNVVFQLTVRNSGKQPATNLVIANPVPAELAYVGAASGSPAPELSTDGKRFAPIAQLTAHGANGQLRAAKAADVRVVRWRIASVPAGGTANVSFRAVIK